MSTNKLYLLNLISFKISKYVYWLNLKFLFNISPIFLSSGSALRLYIPLKFSTAEEKDKCRGFASMSREQEVKYRFHG